MPKMKYVGQGKWLRGVPKRDLSSEEVVRCGGSVALMKTGLYKVVKKRIKIKKSPGLDNPYILPVYRKDREVNDG